MIVILCGSSPSFMIRQVLHSKALYNRSEYELHLQAFTLPETKVIAEFEKKLSLFPNPRQRTIERVLVTNEGAAPALIARGYFDRVITLDELFNEPYW